MKKYLLSLFFLCSLIVYGQAQITVTGAVTDEENLPLPGVNVLIKSNPSQGTITDFDGNYSLEVAEGETLVFTFIGMKTQEVAILDQTTINITMAPEFFAISASMGIAPVPVPPPKPQVRKTISASTSNL